MPFVLVFLPLMFAVPARVDPGEARHLIDAKNQLVYVIDQDRREWQGTLLDATKTDLVLDGEFGTRRFALDNVRRVDADNDSVKDGAIKGAVFGAVLGLIIAQDVGGRAIPEAAALYSLLGMGLDALNRCKQTVYRAPAPAPQVAFRVRW